MVEFEPSGYRERRLTRHRSGSRNLYYARRTGRSSFKLTGRVPLRSPYPSAIAAILPTIFRCHVSI
ncbi:hypothetical protein CKA32_002936 [Geitlerinema sp. FC II]|nr:hypothetical protein [Geitlerinema sp. CS-897]PPT10279.1 hypothetical protein CKA32_002936 [Geitlerinema sp. FC II]